MSIIINADDFGKDHETNMAICEAFAKGLIHRTTLMANMDGAGEAMDLARQKGFADMVGIHLNLTQGHPLTKEMADDRVMCNEDGMFTADFHRNTFKRFVLPRSVKKNIMREADAQIARFLELGGTNMHMDSHHHVHTDASVLTAIMPLIQKYGFTSIRLGRNLYKGGNPLMKVYKKWLNAVLMKINKKGAQTNGNGTGGVCTFFGSVNDFENYDGSESLIQSSVVEIMVHPMYIEGELYDTDYPMSQMSKRLGGAV